jgi:hypothetical protein
MHLTELTEFQAQFFKNIHSSKLPFSNFYRFYDAFTDQVILLNASKWADCYFEDKDAKEVKAISDRIVNLKRKIEELRVALNQETQFNRQVEINVKMKNLGKQVEEIIKSKKQF